MQGLKKKRKELGRTQTEVAAAIGITQQAYSEIESGKHFPNKQNLDKLRAYFKCGLEELE